MALINEMTGLNSGVVCVKKNLQYTTYNTQNTGCTCYELLTEINENIQTGEKIVIYKNINENVYINSGDTEILVINEDFNSWVEYYINSFASTGYTGTTGGTEERIIFDIEDNTFYKIDHLVDSCEKETNERIGILNVLTNKLWFTGDSENFFYDMLDNCGVETGGRYVYLTDLNPYSPNYKKIYVLQKCQNETPPIIETCQVTNITNSSAMLSGITKTNGGFEIQKIGFCYARYLTPSINNEIIQTNVLDTHHNAVITGLTSSTTYYYNIFATNAMGTSYGETLSFTTNI